MIVDCAHYAEGCRQHEGRLSLAEAEERIGDGDSGFVWVGLADPTAEELADAQERFGLHELAVEDAMNRHQRPKIEDFDGGRWFVVLKTARYNDGEEAVEFGEVHVFIGPAYVVVVRHGETNPLGGVRARLEERPVLMQHGPPAVVWAVLDKIVDDYAPVVDGLENDVDEVEQAIFENGEDQTARIYFLRRELTGFFRAVRPLVDPVDQLATGELMKVDTELRSYFRDVADHLERVHGDILMERDLLDAVLQTNLATIGVRQNEVVRKVTGWAAIIAVPTLIASIYGMNFEHIPELEWQYGYPFALGLMVAVALLIWRFLKRVGWL